MVSKKMRANGGIGPKVQGGRATRLAYMDKDWLHLQISYSQYDRCTKNNMHNTDRSYQCCDSNSLIMLALLILTLTTFNSLHKIGENVCTCQPFQKKRKRDNALCKFKFQFSSVSQQPNSLHALQSKTSRCPIWAGQQGTGTCILLACHNCNGAEY